MESYIYILAAYAAALLLAFIADFAIIKNFYEKTDGTSYSYISAKRKEAYKRLAWIQAFLAFIGGFLSSFYFDSFNWYQILLAVVIVILLGFLWQKIFIYFATKIAERNKKKH